VRHRTYGRDRRRTSTTPQWSAAAIEAGIVRANFAVPATVSVCA
jgi:hypothetical protein